MKPKRKGTKPPKKLDTRLDRERKDKLKLFLNENLPNCIEDWDHFKELLQNAARHTFGKKKKISNDWFDDQDADIQELLKNKKMNRSVLREKIRSLKNNWFQRKAEEAELFAEEKNYREFYATLNAVYAQKTKNSHPVKSKDGVLLTSPQDIQDRWVEHFSELLNQPTDVNMNILDDIEQQLIIDSLNDPTEEELVTALKNTKLGKSPGPDGVLPEVLVTGGASLFLLSLFTIFWTTENIPADLADPNITILFKKGDRRLKARLIVDGELTKAFEYNSGVKQGCKLAPTLYGIYAAVLLWLAYKNIKHKYRVKIWFRYDGDLFDLSRLKCKTKVTTEYIREAQYADDIAILSDSSNGLQILLTAHNQLSKKMGLRINTTKTEHW